MKLTKLRARDMTALAMLIALNIVMAEIFKLVIVKNVLELSFGFVPIAVAGMLFGPAPAMIVAGIADVIGALIFSGAEFFPGYTLTALLTGLFYGLFLHKEADTKRGAVICVLLAQALVSLICYSTLNTLWAYLMGYARTAQYIVTRLIVNLVAYPVYSFVLLLLVKYRKTFERAVKS